MVCYECRLKRTLKRKESSVVIDKYDTNTVMKYDTCPVSDDVDTSLNYQNEDSMERFKDLEELLQCSKDKFASLKGSNPMKIKIHTILPLSWSNKKISKKFNITIYLAPKSKEYIANSSDFR